MLRAALYARFSTDQQSAASTGDQLRICRELAEKLGAVVVAEFEDAGISGRSLGNRPGVMALLSLASRRGCDVVIAEHTDRLSRSLSGGGSIYEDLVSYGVKLVTVNQGEVDELHVGISSTLSAMFIKEIGRKTRRGQEGVVLSGRAMGSIAYGYRARIEHDDKGERIPGLREIDPDEAEVVRRIFRDYADGVSPWALAAALNAEGVDGPRGGTWERSTIIGNPARGLGMLRNELYRGVRVWGKMSFVKDRVSGKRRPVPGVGSVRRMDVPELRIIPEELWNRVQLRLTEMAIGPRGENRGNRRPGYLLAGLIRCGLCGGPMSRSGCGTGLRCTTRAAKGPDACTNSRSPGYGDVEARVLEGVRANLLHPDAIAEAVKAFNAEVAADRKAAPNQRAPIEAELRDVRARLGRLVREVEDGMPWGAVKERHTQLEARAGVLLGQLDALSQTAEVVKLPVGAAREYREVVATLGTGLQGDDARMARDKVRALIEEVRFLPLDKRGCYDLEITADLAPIMNGSATGTVRAGESRSRFIRSHSIPVRFRLAG